MRPGLTSRGSSDTVRAISGPLASGDQDAGRPVFAVASPGVLGLDMRVDGVRDRRVSAPGLVLVDHRGPFAVMPHPGHQVPEPGTALRRELISSVPEVVEMQPRHADRRDSARPRGHLVEVATPQRTTLDAREDERAGLVLDEGGEMSAQGRDDRIRNADDAATGACGTAGSVPAAASGLGRPAAARRATAARLADQYGSFGIQTRKRVAGRSFSVGPSSQRPDARSVRAMWLPAGRAALRCRAIGHLGGG